MLAGLLFRVQKQLLFTIYLLIFAICTILVPHVQNITQLGCVQTIKNFITGAANSATQSWILELWAPNNSPFLNAYHLFYATGAVLGPLMSTPFLSKERKAENTTLFSSTKNNVTESSEFRDSSRIALLYVLTSLFFLTSSLINFLSLFYHFCKKSEIIQYLVTNEYSGNASDETDETNSQLTLSKLQLSLIIAMTALMLCFEGGKEVEIGQYLSVFVVNLGMYFLHQI